MKPFEDKTTNKLLTAGAVVALFFLARRSDARTKKRLTEEEIASDISAAQASTLHSLLHPYGSMWLGRWIVGFDAEGMMQVAKQIKDLNAVVSYYQKIVGEKEPSLHDDFKLCMGPDLYEKFLSYATKGKTGSWFYAKESENVPANRWVLTIADTNVRRTPVLTPRYSLGSNIVKTVPKRMLLGATTGKFAYDEFNKVLFIEFWTLKKDKNERATYFVAKSQIELLTKQEYDTRQKKEGKFQLQVLEGLIHGSEKHTQEVITTTDAQILNEKFERVGWAKPNTIIGFPLMTLDTGKGKHIQIKTIQGLLRWVRFDEALIRERQL